MATYQMRINGTEKTVSSDDPNQPLLYVLRDLGLTAAKFGCGFGQCGACTILVEGRATRSCVAPVAGMQGTAITTLEGIGSANALHPVQTAFIEHQVPQCGYCTSGIIVGAVALLAEKPKPSEADIRTALEGNLCRCGTHGRVVAAVLAASGQRG